MSPTRLVKGFHSLSGRDYTFFSEKYKTFSHIDYTLVSAGYQGILHRNITDHNPVISKTSKTRHLDEDLIHLF